MKQHRAYGVNPVKPSVQGTRIAILIFLAVGAATCYFLFRVAKYLVAKISNAIG